MKKVRVGFDYDGTSSFVIQSDVPRTFQRQARHLSNIGMHSDHINHHQIARPIAAILVALLLAAYAYLGKKLTPQASLVAVCVGLVIGSSGAAPLASLLFFFLFASRATKVGKGTKAVILHDYAPTGRRKVSQVLANSFGAIAVLGVDAWIRSDDSSNSVHSSFSSFSRLSSFLQQLFLHPASAPARLAVVAHFAACAGDTFSSELGVLSPWPPRHILMPWRVVPAGTNGGVSAVGFASAALGGFLVGAGSELAERLLAPRFGDTTITAGASSSSSATTTMMASAGSITLFAVAAGVFGSALDSVLGCTLQYSGGKRKKQEKEQPQQQQQQMVVVVYDEPGVDVEHISGLNVLSNDAVNVITACAVTFLTWWWFL